MKNTILNLSLIAVAILLSALTYSSLSPEIAIHWTNGEVTRTAPKLLGVLLTPIIMIITYWILSLLFKTDPNKKRISNRIKTIVISTVLLLLFSIHVAVLAVGLGYDLNMNIVAGLIIGTITMILGNIMPQTKKNFIFGLRTPWTLSNEKVWAISNRFTGRIIFLAGFLIIISVIFIPEYNFVFTVSLLLLIAFIGTIHSFLVYKRVDNENE